MGPRSACLEASQGLASVCVGAQGRPLPELGGTKTHPGLGWGRENPSAGAPEGQRELAERSSARRCTRWATRSKAEASQSPPNVLGLGGDLEPLHVSPAIGANGDVDAEDVSEEKGPRVSLGGGFLRSEELELVCLSEGCGRSIRERLVFLLRHDPSAALCTRGEEPMEANHVDARWRNHGAEARNEAHRVENDGAGAVAPGLLEGVLQPAVGEQLEPLLGDGGLAR